MEKRSLTDSTKQFSTVCICVIPQEEYELPVGTQVDQIDESDIILNVKNRTLFCPSDRQELPYSQKNLELLCRKIDRKKQTILKTVSRTSYKKSLSSLGLRFEQFLSLFQVRQLKPFFMRLKEIQGVSQYGYGAFLVHRQGEKTVKCFDIFRGAESRNAMSVADFTQFYLQVKKSKNKHFSRDTMASSGLNVFGTFLSQELEMRGFRVLLVLSREDFLFADKSEYDRFSLISIVLILALIRVLTLEERSNRLNLCLELKKRDQSLLKSLANYFHLPQSNYQDYAQEQLADQFHLERVELLGELLNTLQHELNNPLFGLKLASDMLLDEQTDEDVGQFLKDISENCTRCNDIIQNFSRLYQEGRSVEKVDLIALVNRVMILTKSVSKQIPKNIYFCEYLQKNPYFVTNATWLSQILFNLIVNSSQAILEDAEQKKHSLFKNYEIRFSVESCKEGVRILVQDNGPGIPEHMRQKIFTPFYTTKTKGSGLGLAICRKLADDLGGNLQLIESKLPGARFELTLKDLSEDENSHS